MHPKKKKRSYNSCNLVQRTVLKFIANVDLKRVALRSVEIEKTTGKMSMDPTLFTRITGPGKTPSASVALGCTGSDTVSNRNHTGDSLAKKSIRSYFFVDYGKIDADHSSADSLRDGGKEQSKAVKLQHRE
jgi:hypothetical protein